MATIFSRIIAGEIPSFKIAENDQFYAFLDVFPLVPGHTLVVPKKETDKFFDMDASDLGAVLQFARPIAKAIEKAFPCQRCGMAVIGLEVPHAHIHLVPLQTVGDINFTKEKLHPSESSLAEMAASIRANLQG